MTSQCLKKMMTIGNVAELLNMKKPTLYSWVNNGIIPSYKLNGLIRFDRDEIEEWVKQSKVAPIKLLRFKPPNRSTSQEVGDIVDRSIASVTGKKSRPKRKQ